MNKLKVESCYFLQILWMLSYGLCIFENHRRFTTVAVAIGSWQYDSAAYTIFRETCISPPLFYDTYFYSGHMFLK